VCIYTHREVAKRTIVLHLSRVRGHWSLTSVCSYELASVCARVCTTGPLIHHSPLGKSSLHPLVQDSGACYYTSTTTTTTAPFNQSNTRRRLCTSIKVYGGVGNRPRSIVLKAWVCFIYGRTVYLVYPRVSMMGEFGGGGDRSWGPLYVYTRILTDEHFFFAENQLFHRKNLRRYRVHYCSNDEYCVYIYIYIVYVPSLYHTLRKLIFGNE